MKSLYDFAIAGMKAQAEANKLCHRNDPETSREAAKKMVKSGKIQGQERLVYFIIQRYKNTFTKYHQFDFTAKELVNHTYTLNYFQIQRRLSGLHRKGYIERTGEKRNGCAVWRLK